MRILITGICGFVGSELARWLPEFVSGGVELSGIDNLTRPGSETNRAPLRRAGVRVVHGDIRCASDLDTLPPVDWVIDAAANSSILAGVDGRTSSRQLVEHNLIGTVNVLEYCKRHGAGLALISTNRVYGTEHLARIPTRVAGDRFEPDESAGLPRGCSREGVSLDFPVEPPLSLYGASKLASETIAREYGHAFGLRIVINRCGIMAGAAQFGTAEQGVISYWVRAYASRRPLRYLGFGGTGFQVRDALHPRDLAALLARQLAAAAPTTPGVWNVGGGPGNAVSLAQLSEWCRQRFGPHEVQRDERPRRCDAPWIVMDNRAVAAQFDWRPEVSLAQILDEVARHHAEHPNLLDLAEPSPPPSSSS